MKTPIEAVLFDYGMVLSGPPDPAAKARMHEITGFDPEAFHAAYWAPRHAYDRGEHTGESYWQAVGKHGGAQLTPEQVADLIDADTALWTQVNEPMVAWAGRLQAAGIRTGILSNLGDAMTAGVLEKFDWLAGFDHCVWSHALHLAKPEPEIYRHAAEGLGVATEKILFLDDREDNVAGGIAAGMQVIRYTDHAEFERELMRRGLGWLWKPVAKG
jgi:putative hydrolase of the HAD superfamily